MRKAKIEIKSTQYKVDSSIGTLKSNLGKKKTSYERVKKLIENDTSGGLLAHYNLDGMLDEINSIKASLIRL